MAGRVGADLSGNPSGGPATGTDIAEPLLLAQPRVGIETRPANVDGAGDALCDRCILCETDTVFTSAAPDGTSSSEATDSAITVVSALSSA
jgi:hypothetical protein